MNIKTSYFGTGPLPMILAQAHCWSDSKRSLLRTFELDWTEEQGQKMRCHYQGLVWDNDSLFAVRRKQQEKKKPFESQCTLDLKKAKQKLMKYEVGRAVSHCCLM